MADDGKRFGKVAVLMGGQTAERDISLQTGDAVLQSLLYSGVDAHGVDWQGEVDQLAGFGFDRAFIALHGRGGEDGQIQGLLLGMDIPFTGSGMLACALSMDKVRCKQLWAGVGLPTPAFAVLKDDFDAAAIVAELGLPLMLKPAHEGSSVGACKVTAPEQLHGAYLEARVHDPAIMVEQWITGPEYTAGVLDDVVFPLIRIETPREFYDYEAKYHSDDTNYICPAELSDEDDAQFRDLAREAFRTLGGSGWGRVDFMLDTDGHPWLLEVNTVPGMTSHSLVPMAAKVHGLSFDELVLEILKSSFGNKH
jgi:D-alanine-D-alanine ligase